MRKNNTAIIFGSLFFSCSVMAANGTLAPTVVPMVNGGQASIAISNTSPNLFTVPGDRIIAVNSLDGALTNNEQTASGGVVVATVNKKPFTFILETERGLNLSIQAVPREGASVGNVHALRIPACDHQPGRPWRKITRRLVSGPSDKGNPAGPGGAVFSGRCRMDGESPEDGPLCRGK